VVAGQAAAAETEAETKTQQEQRTIVMRPTTEHLSAIFPGWTVRSQTRNEDTRALRVTLEISEKSMQAQHGPRELSELLAAQPVRARRPLGIPFHGRTVGKR
jgi:hypothetical protein